MNGFTLGPRARKALRITGYVLLGLVCFVYGVHLTFPYDRVKDKGVEWLSSRYDVTVGGVERGWLPGDFALTRVQLRTRPSKPGEVPKIIVIDRLDVDVHILPILAGKVDIDLDAALGPGGIDGSISVPLGHGDTIADLSSHNLSLSDVPGLASVIGMPMGGRGSVSAHLDLPGSDWSHADARLSVDCPNCTFGGEGAFFKPKNQNTRNESFVGQGVPVPLITITTLKAQWSIAKGKLTTDKFEFASPHINVQLDFTATVDKDITKSRIESACLRYRGTDELKTLDQKFYNALELTGGPLGPDDLRHLKLVGTLGSFKALPKFCGDNAPPDATQVDTSGTTAPRPHAGPSLSNVPTGDTTGITGPTPMAPVAHDAGLGPIDANLHVAGKDDVQVGAPEGAAAGAGAEGDAGVPPSEPPPQVERLQEAPPQPTDGQPELTPTPPPGSGEGSEAPAPSPSLSNPNE